MAAVHELTAPRTTWQDPEIVVGRINRSLEGWANYFCIGSVGKAYRALDLYAKGRLRRWLCWKHKDASWGTARYPDEYLYERLGLVCLPRRPRNPSRATA